MKNYIIKQEGDEWILYDSTGKKVLGRHKSKEGALAQEKAIQARKGMFESILEVTYDDEAIIQAFENDLQTIKDVDVFAVGTWRGVNSPPEGDKYETADLEAMVEAFNAGVMSPKLKITHGADKEQVDIGDVSNLRVIGDKLIGDYVNVPKALYELMKKGLFSKRSAEVVWNLKDKAGKTWKRVMKAVALLAPGQKPAVEALSEGYQFEALYCYEVPPQEDREYKGNIQNIIRAWGKWAGSHTRCTAMLSGKPGISDPKRLCAWLHKKAEGKWPGEKGHELAYEDYEPSNEELQSVELVAGGILSYIDEENKFEEVRKKMAIDDLIKKYQKIDPSIKTEEDVERFLDAQLNEGQEAKAKIKEHEKKEKENRLQSVNNFIEQAKKDGKILPKEEEGIKKNFESLLDKGDEDGVESLKTFISGGPKRVDLDETSREDKTVKEYDTEKPPADEVDRLAREYVADGKAKDYQAGLEVVRTSHKELWEKYLAEK